SGRSRCHQPPQIRLGLDGVAIAADLARNTDIADRVGHSVRSVLLPIMSFVAAYSDSTAAVLNLWRRTAVSFLRRGDVRFSVLARRSDGGATLSARRENSAVQPVAASRSGARLNSLPAAMAFCRRRTSSLASFSVRPRIMICCAASTAGVTARKA